MKVGLVYTHYTPIMISYNNIRSVHLEISSLCNARCPLCPRNFRGYNYNDGYIERNLTLDDAKTIFTPNFLNQLTNIRINGNFGDIVMNPQGPDIVEYFKSINPDLKITISTNGSARSEEFWKRLAGVADIDFCIDGLVDTHELYRQNTDWSTVLKNAEIVIKNNGIANWKFIIFDHNKHQLKDCEKLSKELGFSRFKVIDHGRNTGPVYDNNGNLVHIMGNYKGETSFPILFHKKQTDLVLLEDILPNRDVKNNINCEVKNNFEIYIASTGEVYPCCFTGFSPRTYGHGEYYQAVNEQIKSLLPGNNNALKVPLKDCINWFNSIEESWKISTYEQGRLVVCDDVCGSK